MTIHRAIALAFALTLVPAMAPAGASAPCPERHRTVHRVCRDGDRRCDIDGRCDGICLIGYCQHPRPACVPYGVSMCRKWSSHLRLYSGAVPQTIELGKGAPVSTIAEFQCADRRRSCKAPPQPCRMTLSGASNVADIPCQIRFYGSLRLSVALLPSEGDLLLIGALELPGPAPGSYGWSDGMTGRLDLFHTPRGDEPSWSMNAGAVQIVLTDPVRTGRLDVVHGALDAVFDDFFTGPAPVPGQVHVEF